MARTVWTNGFEERPMEKQLNTITVVCELETINSVTKDDLLFLLRWLAQKTITEQEDE